MGTRVVVVVAVFSPVGPNDLEMYDPFFEKGVFL